MLRKGRSAVPDPQVEASVFAPSPSLRPYVRQFVLIENLADRANTLLPEAAVIAGIRFKGECSRDGQSGLCAVVTGLRDKPRKLTHTRGSGTIVAMLTANGAAAILRQPPGELFNTTMPIEFQVRRSQLDAVEEQLAEAPNHAGRVNIFEKFLRGQIRERRADRIVEAAVSCIRESRGRMRIDDLARRAGLSQSALERRFRQEVGAPPKKFAGIVRLRNVVRLRQTGATLTEIAHAAGYTDQSHFIKDFTRFAGQAPELFFQSETAFC
jgi:AraC-like DNA-binding protein